MAWSPEWLADYQARRKASAAAGEQPAPAKRRKQAAAAPPPLERECLPAVLQALKLHPLVAWAERINVGGAWFAGTYVRFGWEGMADITGQMRDGRRLEVEVKRPGESPRPEQVSFLELVGKHGGCAFVARNADDVFAELRGAP